VLFPPEETHKLLDRAGTELAADITPGMYDPVEYPLLASATRFEVLQAPGEALFVPSGWHHQVTSLNYI
jgi:Cupin-like domain